MTTATAAATTTKQNKRNNINFDAEEELTGKILLKTTPRQEDSQRWDFPNATLMMSLWMTTEIQLECGIGLGTKHLQRVDQVLLQ